MSSFYGRKGSTDRLNADYSLPPGAQQPVSGRDDASSFFNPDRVSREALNSERFGSAGYNRGSFFFAGREEPIKGGRDEEEPATPGNEAWDIYADFNNAGPRYSNHPLSQPQGGYQPLEALPKSEDPNTPTGPVELVTVPALGPEWQRSELRDMTKAGRRDKKSETRRQGWKDWNRGNTGLFGTRWFTRKSIIIALFCLIIVIIIVLIFTIPRVPGIAFNGNTPLTAATGAFNASIPIEFSVAPANFSFPAFASLQLNTGGFLPITFSHFRAQVYDLDTNMLIASGDLGHYKVPANSFPDILVPLNFTYVASNSSDQTWANWHNACKNSIQYANGTRPGVDFRLLVKMDIIGLPGSHSDSTAVTNVNCPIELPSTAS